MINTNPPKAIKDLPHSRCTEEELEIINRIMAERKWTFRRFVLESAVKWGEEWKQ